MPPRINDVVFAGYDDDYIYAKVDEKRAEIEAGSCKLGNFRSCIMCSLDPALSDDADVLQLELARMEAATKAVLAAEDIVTGHYRRFLDALT